MIRVVKSGGPKLKVGEILPFSNGHLLNELHIDDFNQSKYLVPIIDIAEECPFLTLAKMKIDTYHISEMYECPHTQMEFYGFVPMYLITENLEKFLKPTSHNEILFDKEYQWGQHFKISSNEFIPCTIYEHMLGTGYTHGASRNDGMSTKRLFAMDLADGSTIIGLTHVWFNK